MRRAVGVKRERGLQKVCGSGPDEPGRLFDEYERSALGRACHYALEQWERLEVFLSDGAVPST